MMLRVVFVFLSSWFWLFLVAGCSGGPAAVPGKVHMTSTEQFKHLKGSKSPAPQKPPP